MNKFNLIKLTQEDIPNYLDIGVREQPCVLYGIHDKSYAWICKEEMCDLDVIKQNNINYKRLEKAPGSTIVCSEGDLDLGFFGSEEFCREALRKVSEKFSEILTGSTLINNDFMYNDNKYGAYTAMSLGDTYYIGVHISNNINKDLINQVCKKPVFKNPEKLPIVIDEQCILKIFKETGGN